MLIAARRHGLQAIDGPYLGTADDDRLRAAATRARDLGFDGKWAIHPDQIAVANEVFAPTADEVARAEEAIEVYRRAEAEGLGAIGRDGRLVDAAHMRLAANVLRKATHPR